MGSSDRVDVRFGDAELDRLDALCEHEGRCRSAIVRSAVASMADRQLSEPSERGSPSRSSAGTAD